MHPCNFNPTKLHLASELVDDFSISSCLYTDGFSFSLGCKASGLSLSFRFDAQSLRLRFGSSNDAVCISVGLGIRSLRPDPCHG
jgi:hypothetical protein